MTVFKVGDRVSCSPPYDVVFPGVVDVVGVDEAGNAIIDGGHGLDDTFLTLVEAGSGSAPPPVVPKIITNYAFQRRFTDTELVTIEMVSAGTDQIAAMLRVNQRLSALARFIDLASPITIAGVTALESAGILGAGRAEQILGVPVAPHEVP
jgi:hypothetical protein